jgi:PEGA domain
MTHHLLARGRRLGAEDRGAAIRARLIYQLVDDTPLSEQDEPGSSPQPQPVPVTKQSRTIESVRWAAAASRRSFAALSRSIREILQRSRVRWEHAVAVLLFAVVTGITIVIAQRLFEVTPTPQPRESAAAALGAAADATGTRSSTDPTGVAPAITKRGPQASERATASSQTPADLTAQRRSSSSAVTSKPRPSVAQSAPQSVAAAETRPAALPKQRATSPATGMPVLGGVLSVTSDPSGAEVYVDGRKLFGRTPMAVSGLPAGDHVLGIVIDGYENWSDGVKLVGDQTTHISVRMQPTGK